MNSTRFTLRKAGLALILGLMLAACGKDDPAKMLADARSALEKRDFNAASVQVRSVLQENPGNGEARLLFGRILLEQADLAGAEREFRKAIESGQAREQVAPLLVRTMTEAGEGQKAIAEFGSLQSADAQAQAELLTALGRAHFTMGDRTKAAESFEQAIKVKPDLSAALLGKAAIQASGRDFAAAQAIAEQVIAKDADNIEAQLLKGDLLSAQQKTAEAEAAYRDAIKSKPDSIRAHQRLVSLLIGVSKLDEADKALADMKKVAPNNLPTVYLDSLLHLRRSKFTQARDTVAHVLKVAPTHGPALIVAATANIRLGQHLQAQTLLEKLLAAEKNNVLGRKLLAESLVAVRDSGKALETLKPLMEGEVTDPVVLNLAGQAYLLAGDFERSTAYFEKLASIKPDSAEARTRLGLARLSSGDSAHAMEDLEAATRLDTGNVQADIALISAHLRKGDVPKALAAVAALEKKQPDNALTHNIKGAALIAAKDMAGARKAFERAYELQPANIGAVAQLAKMDLADKKPEEARKRFEALIDKDSKNVRAHLLFAQFLSETSAPAKDLRAAIQRAIDADPTQVEPRLLMVRHLISEGDSKQALNVAQQAQAASPDNPDVLRMLGRTQMAVGERQQAVTSFAKLQAMQPQNPVALIELADAQRAAGDNAACEQSLRKALVLKPDLVDAQQRLAGLLLSDKRGEDALKIARDIQKQRPEAAVGYAVEADIHIFEKRWPQAVASLQQAYKLAKTPQIVVSLHNAYLQQNKKAEADQVVAEWFRISPKDNAVRAHLAQRALTGRQFAEAANHYREMLRVTPDQPMLLNNLAWVTHQLKDPKAVEYAEAAHKGMPNSPDIMETLGSILVDRGQNQRGIEMLKQAADAAPKSPVIQFGYARGLAKAGDKSAAKKVATQAGELVPAGSPMKSDIEEFIKTL